MPKAPLINPVQADFVLYARTGKIDKLLETLANGAVLDYQDGDGRTALMHAACLGKADVVTTLLQRGANPNLKTTDGKTAWAMASLRKFDNLVRILGEVTDTTSVGYDIEDILNSSAPAFATYFRLVKAIASQRHRDLRHLEEVVTSLDSFITFALPNGFLDQLWQRGFGSIELSAELLDLIGKSELSKCCLRALELMKEQLARCGGTEASTEAWIAMTFDDDIDELLTDLDNKISSMDVPSYNSLYDETLRLVRKHKADFIW